MTARRYSGVSATLSYDALDHLVHWDGHAGTTEDYLYDASGERVLRRVVKSTGTQFFTYPFRLMDSTYNGSGVQQLENDYYTLAGRLIGEREAGVTVFLLTDELGSVLTSISAVAGSAAVTSNQVYSPYGAQRYRKGTVPTDKGFTGQYLDASGLNYDHARYYDAVVGRFVSADIKQGNAQGMDPYSYVGNNPETRNDPTGQYYATSVPLSHPGGAVGYIDYAAGIIRTIKYADLHYGGTTALDGTFTSDDNSRVRKDTFTFAQERKNGGYNPDTDKEHSPTAKIGRATGWTNMVTTWNDPHASGWDKAGATWNFVTKTASDAVNVAMILGGAPEGDAVLGGIDGVDAAIIDAVDLCGGGLSFTAPTPVATSHGEQAIGTLHPGEKVWAYNPQTHKMELQPIVHVWVNHDDDLVDLALTFPTKTDAHGKATSAKSEVLHTNQRHPFLTQEKGFLPVRQLQMGMHIMRADGSVGIVAKMKTVPGTMTMYNLEVAQDHTFTVGDGQWIVHNCARAIYDGVRMMTSDALDSAVQFLGDGYRDVSNGRFVSADGLRQVRMGDGDILGWHGGGPHINFETWTPDLLRMGRQILQDNIHVFLIDP